MSSHRSGRAHPLRTPLRAASLRGARLIALLLLGTTSWNVSSLNAQTIGGANEPRDTAPAPAPDPTPGPTPGPAPDPIPDPGAVPEVEPTGDWLRFDEIAWSGASVEIHLRTGYERPIILPEPVVALGDRSLPGTEVTIDTEVVLFAPTEHFAARPMTLVGELTGTRYRLAVRSDSIGSRVPLRIVRR